MVRAKIKAIILFVLLVPYAISMIGMFTSYFSFFYKNNIQAVVSSLEEDKLELLILSSSDFEKIRWTDNEREFEREGKMFDVSRIESHDGSYFIYCENDLFEDLLVNYLNAPGSKTKSTQIFQAQFFEPLKQFNCNDATISNIDQNFFSANLYVSVPHELKTPPPKVS
ncbi:MAG TPA: hypothetical protein VGQ59_00890 [Cyclobacteriaceae bacterium]|jgi:hypothetical protein|nr:hypothetical protein [Cyclobacteriaceae bacterium]